ncbi:MAG: hypothetical protein EPN84_04820 [Legionella sp.]|nr:MAG: hypothetical protein EPN84_04820 [Legionella sp.]
MELEDFNGMLLDNSGVTGNLLRNALAVEKKHQVKYSSLFFQVLPPDESLLAYSSSIVIAPICLCIIAVEAILACVVDILNALFEIAYLDHEESLKSIMSSVTNLVAAVSCAIGAVLSPFINFVDTVGCIVNTLQADEDFSLMP